MVCFHGKFREHLIGKVGRFEAGRKEISKKGVVMELRNYAEHDFYIKHEVLFMIFI